MLMRNIIANAAFIVSLCGIWLSGDMSLVMPFQVSAFFFAAFAVAAYVSGMWVFGKRM